MEGCTCKYVSTSWNRNLTSYNHILCFFDKCDCLVIKVICLEKHLFILFTKYH